jgi:signal transduction histidine kinase
MTYTPRFSAHTLAPEDGGRPPWWASFFTHGRAFSPITVAVALAPVSMGSVLVDGLPKGAEAPLAWYAALGSFVVVFALFISAGWVINRVLPHPSPARAIAVLLVYAASEVGRTTLFALALARNGVEFDFLLHHRILAGALTGMLLLGLVSRVVNNHSAYAADFVEVTLRKRELEIELTQLHSQMDSFIDTLREFVAHTVDGALSPIIERFHDRKSVRKAVDDIVTLSENVVRPLSHDIYQAFPDGVTQELRVSRVPLRTLMSLTTTVKPFQPGLIALAFFMLLFSAALFLAPFPQGLLTLIALTAVTGAVHFVGARYVHHRLPQWTATQRFVVIALFYAVGPVTVLLVLAAFIEGGLGGSPATTISYLVLVVEFVSWGLAVLPALRQAQRNILHELVATTSELAQVRSRAEVRLRREKQRLAAIVHGDIQSTLMATALKLQQKGVTSADVPGIIEDARSVIAATLADTTRSDIASTFEAIAAGVNDAWSGLVELTWKTGRGVKKVVNSDSDLAETLWQVLREATTNAVKHGRATKVSIELTVNHGHHLLCEVSDNGVTRELGSHSGGGLRLFHAVADRVELVRRDNCTTLILGILLQGAPELTPVR